MLKPPTPYLPDMINNIPTYRLLTFVNNKNQSVKLIL
jgi:hypothetical protein